jgi:hypothetical protein
MDELEKDFIKGRDCYPKDLVEAFNLLKTYETKGFRRFGGEGDGIAFTNVEKQKDKSKIKCFTCGEMGHYANNCQKKIYKNKEEAHAVQEDSENKEAKSEMMHTNVGTENTYDIDKEDFSFHIMEGEICLKSGQGTVNKDWILLDSQSTTDVFCNPRLLSNIRKSETEIVIHCNAGAKKVNMKGMLKNYGEVWFSPDGIANILSLARVKKRFPV